MYNPSYLVKSRHDIYYFRYPLPINDLAEHHQRRVSVSLKTRCPKQALRLARMLAYHSANLIAAMDWERMEHAEIMSIMKSYYAEVLERAKARIDKDGQLPAANVENIRKQLEEADALIEDGSDEITELLGVEYENPEDSPLKQDLQRIMERHDLSFPPDSNEYGMMKDAYKHLRRNYYNDLLSYNDHVMNFSLADAAQRKTKNIQYKPEHRLKNIIVSYMDEIKSGIKDSSYEEQRNCLNYLIDWLGEDYQITKLDNAKVREVKELLRGTPKGRNKSQLTAGKLLIDQIAIAKENDLDVMSHRNVNKYLGYFETLFKWAKNNRYISDNPFTGIRVPAGRKKDQRRDLFNKEEIATILENLTNDTLVKNKSNYWGALLAVYTGARRNEIAGLTPDDVKKDAATDIWYIDITDEEEEGKDLKTSAAKRIVPVHSSLIEKGFLNFVEESRNVKIETKEGHKPRLLYDLTYTKREKWGRNLGRWFNERYLTTLRLKTKKKTLHSLRHSFITFLNTTGVDVATIKSLVGHEPDTVTTEVYTHYGIDHLPIFKEVIEKLPY